MDLSNYIKKQNIYSCMFILVGIAALGIGFFLGYEKKLMFGIALGCIPVGLGSFVVYKLSEKRIDMMKNVELENEERNVFINTKSGQKAFWISYYYIIAIVILKNVISLSIDRFLIITLFFMPLVYFLCVVFYHRKY
ncbi:hypothetical protein BJV85_001392 [Clostridium acetobutylicum]|uniref:Predicted membrane protein n=1 Tax=Clostridium acetobutylicum (strain ATCC 824 / DSM 792 / JCM 1419 / IAM 19013 / LMG 5710 / NBRC 13948 / NRRL B-527 / VKM B-1787 / 2291 / W) TaxID=272562 RepID=Q97G75_CLOAB|nr:MULTISPECIES: hypothetical protein [Clostridium]AAK80448.1 Predicted membrane protein [Clostridium acetobutylicum ATCC 824]ADZ21545.1 membrane protein [Clostridium acetobutylicum EA 2018]AEI32386.1 hypothetical protein SMB_G2529 [Clostridium acetobutylicum DSM 1731]AWV79135.1 hypothetical protein DK921_03280 [Clostridium acetobutylicum]MBC2394902.1 hypothetical protein [Clostridium acetobutylicum]